MRILKEDLQKLIQENLLNGDTQQVSEGLAYHIERGVGIDRNIYRPGSEAFFALFREVRSLCEHDLYLPNLEERELLSTDLGEFGLFEGELVPLDWPMLYEAEYKGEKVELNKPKRIRGGKGRAYVYVKNPKTGKVKRVEFGSSMGDAMSDSKKDKARRKSFGNRHRCADKKDKTKPGYWACRATKFFGRNIPGWW